MTRLTRYEQRIESAQCEREMTDWLACVVYAALYGALVIGAVVLHAWVSVGMQ